jgi:cytochrome c-type biogenesis protein CcmH/NrfG
MLEVEKKMKWFLYAIFAVSLALVAILNFSTAWILLLVVSLVGIVYFLTVEKRVQPDTNTRAKMQAPKLLLALFIISLIFVINPKVSSSGSLGDTVSTWFGVSNTEVRPSLSATLDVSKPVLRDHALLGSGPNTFSSDWLLYKPAEINTTGFWNTSFPFGSGFIPTQFVTTGAVGTVAWLAFLVIFAWLGLKFIKRGLDNKADRFLIITPFMAGLLLWIAAMLYVPSIVILTFAFIFTGLFIAACVATGVIHSREVVFSKNAITGFASTLIMIMLLVGGVFASFGILQRTISLVHFQKALVMANTEGSSIDDISAELGKAISTQPQDVYYRSLAELEFARAQSVVNNSSITTEERTNQFQTAMGQSIASAQAAINKNPGDYENWLLLASLYSYLVPKPIAIDGAYESARVTYEEAKKRNPSNPQIPLLIARLELDHENPSGARQHINEALALKVDYADAYFLLTQIEISENNISQAIKSAETGVLLTPGNSGVLFELGVLKYSNKDYAGAIQALAAALSITPEYANAKYFLGLSYENVARHDEAIKMFEDLKATNPDNQEVATILENLKAGKAPLEGIQPAPTSSERTTPPITDTKTAQ